MSEALEILKSCDAFLEGHFLLSSGRHSSAYCQMAYLQQYPDRCAEVMKTVADKVKEMDGMPNNLSGGQQQRVAIARALVSKPAIILADEPTGNLDSRTSSDVLGLLKMTSQKFHQTIVMITHNNEIAQLADRIIRIEDGRISE